MGIFNNILEKLGIKKSSEESDEAIQPKTGLNATGSVKPSSSTTTTRPLNPASAPQSKQPAKVNQDSRAIPSGMGSQRLTPVKPTPMEMVDVKAKLDKLEADAGSNFDWKKSIVDLLKLLHIDSSFEARKELAVELGCPPEKMKDSINMNIWLHKTVLAKIAENGGNIPKELLD